MTIQPALTVSTGTRLNPTVEAIYRTWAEGNRRMQRIFAPMLFLLLLGFAGNAAAQEFNKKFTVPYCTDSSFPTSCTKTITIYNNTDDPIYPVLQGTLEQGPGVGPNCTTHGDRWLQAAFGDIGNCYAIVYNYLVYVNGIAGILEHSHASINVPWWSKRNRMNNDSNPDVYIDWWNGARTYIFDDSKAVNNSYMTDKTRPVQFAPGSPMISCVSKTIDPENVCDPTSTIAYQTCAAAPDGSNPCIAGSNAIKPETPQQLNEYTLASVDPVFGLTNFNVNYNVSNVDQVYLPVALEPMVNPDRSKNNATNTPGYLGTTLEVSVVRQRLMDFTGATGSVHDPQNPTFWPIYTVQKNTNDEPLYPNAGIRVPGANNVFNFLAQPTMKPGLTPSPKCAAPGCIPKMNNGPWSDTTVVDGMIKQWMTCTVMPTKENCPQSGIYAVVNLAFEKNYSEYFTRCGANFPPWLAPVPNSDPRVPNLYAFLQFVYGWVPFNVACGGIDLPTGTTPMQYIQLSDNFRKVRGTPPAVGQAIFNPYAQLIHGAPNGTPPVSFGLDAAAYAYSIDDGSSFLSQPGVGLIFAVGGAVGLPNPAQYIFPPPVDPEHDIQVILGATTPLKRPTWIAYSLCVDQTLPPAAPSIMFTQPSPTDPDGIQRFSVPTDITTIFKNPCYVTISDAANKVYQFEVTHDLPWPAFNNIENKGGFEIGILACPTPKVPANYTAVEGTQTAKLPIDRNNWCGGINEVSNPTGTPTNAQRFELDTPPSNPE